MIKVSTGSKWLAFIYLVTVYLYIALRQNFFPRQLAIVGVVDLDIGYEADAPGFNTHFVLILSFSSVIKTNFSQCK